MTSQLTSLAQALHVDEDGRALLDRSWWSWAGPHGGLLAGLAVRRAGQQLGADRRVRAVTAHFLRPAAEGPLPLTAEALLEGRSTTVLAVEAGQALRATVTAGSSRDSGLVVAAVAAPDVPGPEDCAAFVIPPEFVPFAQHTEIRPATGVHPLAGHDTAELLTWVRLPGAGPLDAAALVLLCDVLPPALYGAASSPVAVPTVELSVTLTGAEPVKGWVLCRISTRTAAGGWCVDDSEVWAPDGTLLASARQTRRVLGVLA